jgi:hypothetical protein
MVWQYTEADKRLIRKVTFELTQGVAGCNGRGGTSGKVDFQFPPKVTTDSRKGEWDEGDMRGIEPIATFSTSGPREITIQTSYIVDSFEDNSESWTIGRITKNIRTLRGYFGLIRNEKSARENLVIKAELWCILPKAGIVATGRLKSIDVKYGETMVFPPNNAQNAFPLRSDVTLEFRLWTKAAPDSDDDQETQDIKGLAPRGNPAWY